MPIAEKQPVQKKLEPRNYVPIGYNRDIGDYSGPLHPMTGQRLEGREALEYWNAKTYFYEGDAQGNGRVYWVDPQKDQHGEKRSWCPAPAGAPTFSMKVANAIKEAISKGKKGIDALLTYVPTDKMSSEWLRAHGAPEDKIPNSPKFLATQEAKALARLEKLGVKIPKDVKQTIIEAASEIEAPAQESSDDEVPEVGDLPVIQEQDDERI